MRVIITLACTSCKQRNYTSSKNKRTHSDRMEFKKFCKYCNEHTPHRETR
ncbi:50S ribosomal protein L33 [Cohnella faecalis]